MDKIKPEGTKSRSNIKISIVEDDDRVRSSLAELIDSIEGFCCVSQHPNAENALVGLVMTRPEIVLMDINLPGMNGVECVRQLKEKLPETQVVMLTVYQNTNIIYSALAAGACGYLLKKSSPEQLIEAIREVHAGGSPMTGLIAVRDLYDRPSALTAGRLWQRIHLSATLAGVALHPLNQPMEVVDRDRQLNRGDAWARRMAGLVGGAGWQPTFSFRAGISPRTASASPRRALADVLLANGEGV